MTRKETLHSRPPLRRLGCSSSSMQVGLKGHLRWACLPMQAQLLGSWNPELSLLPWPPPACHCGELVCQQRRAPGQLPGLLGCLFPPQAHCAVEQALCRRAPGGVEGAARPQGCWAPQRRRAAAAAGRPPQQPGAPRSAAPCPARRSRRIQWPHPHSAAVLLHRQLLRAALVGSASMAQWTSAPASRPWHSTSLPLHCLQGTWVVILASGGHFAAAVFRRCADAKREVPCLETAEHKTFHRYVVRHAHLQPLRCRVSQPAWPPWLPSAGDQAQCTKHLLQGFTCSCWACWCLCTGGLGTRCQRRAHEGAIPAAAGPRRAGASQPRTRVASTRSRAGLLCAGTTRSCWPCHPLRPPACPCPAPGPLTPQPAQEPPAHSHGRAKPLCPASGATSEPVITACRPRCGRTSRDSWLPGSHTWRQLRASWCRHLPQQQASSTL